MIAKVVFNEASHPAFKWSETGSLKISRMQCERFVPDDENVVDVYEAEDNIEMEFDGVFTLESNEGMIDWAIRPSASSILQYEGPNIAKWKSKTLSVWFEFAHQRYRNQFVRIFKAGWPNTSRTKL